MLRFGIMTDGVALCDWQIKCLQSLLSLDKVELALIIVNRSDAVKKNLIAGIIARLKQFRLKFFLYHLYRRLFCRPNSLKVKNISCMCVDKPILHCRINVKGRYSQFFDSDDVEKIRNHNLDFILRFGFNILRGDILHSAKYGVWSFHHDDEKKYRGRPSCFWEIYYGDAVTGFILQRLNDKLDGGIILRKGFLKTVAFSLSKNIDRVYYKSSIFPAQVCVDILNGNTDYIHSEPSRTAAPLFSLPSNYQVTKFVFRQIKQFFLDIVHHYIYHEEWNCGIIRKPINFIFNLEPIPDIVWFPFQANHQFAADPFGIKKNGKFYFFFEHFDFMSYKGKINYIEMNDDCIFSEDHTVLESSTHLSYPYVFEIKNEVYLVPESHAAREIVLYKSEHFPFAWRRVKTLVSNFAGIDATIFGYGGFWWLFCTDKANGSSDTLYIWYATSLLDEWKPHKLNPVKVDVRSARPAGTPFFYDGKLVRPSQNCSVSYGGSLSLNIIEELSPTIFKETPCLTIKPDLYGSYPSGLHTISSVGDLTVIDGLRYKKSIIVFFVKIFKFMNKKICKIRKNIGKCMVTLG